MVVGSKIRTAVNVVAIAAIAVACGIIAATAYAYWQGQDVYDKVAEKAFPEPLGEVVAAADAAEDEEGSRLAELTVDWEALYAVNPDVVGWLYVPGTAINYPVVHSRDNDEYLYVNFNGEYGNGVQPTYGTPFLTSQNAADFSDPVSFIQAHNMANGTMFSDIPNALGKDADTFNACRTVYLLTPSRNYRLESVSLVVCASNDQLVRSSFASRDDFTAYVQDVMDRSEWECDPAPPAASEVSKMVMLSTCTSDRTGRRCILACAVIEQARPGGATSDGDSDQEQADDSAATTIDEAATTFGG